jgi:hypothetical protein
MSARSTRKPPNRIVAALAFLISSGGLLGAGATVWVAYLKRSDATPKSDAAVPSQSVYVTGSNNSGVTNTAGRDVINNTYILPESAKPSQQGKVGPGGSRSAPFPAEQYIDRGVHRVAGTFNVAVAVQGLPNSRPLLEAMHRALIARDMSVIPLFREKFRQDGTAQRLFGGDAGLAANLKLRDYVDGVLLAEFRFVGPAQLVQDGVYIREAVLEVHAIDPSSGEIRKVLEIREKGGGASAESSSENALTRLEEEVQNNIAGWIWV